jgi:hypothetical protein
MTTHARPRLSLPPKKPNGKPPDLNGPEPELRVRGKSGEVAVKIKTETYFRLVDALPEFERGLREKTGFSVRLSAGALLDWVVKNRPEYLLP